MMREFEMVPIMLICRFIFLIKRVLNDVMFKKLIFFLRICIVTAPVFTLSLNALIWFRFGFRKAQSALIGQAARLRSVMIGLASA